jgi:hypothetical protein
MLVREKKKRYVKECAQNFPVMAMVLNVGNHCSYAFVSGRCPSSV